MSKKENVVPNKPDYPGERPPTPEMPLTLNKKIMVRLFNTWNKRYAKDPSSFSDSLDEDGKPIEDYGECCAVYFQKLYNELY